MTVLSNIFNIGDKVVWTGKDDINLSNREFIVAGFTLGDIYMCLTGPDVKDGWLVRPEHDGINLDIGIIAQENEWMGYWVSSEQFRTIGKIDVIHISRCIACVYDCKTENVTECGLFRRIRR